MTRFAHAVVGGKKLRLIVGALTARLDRQVAHSSLSLYEKTTFPPPVAHQKFRPSISGLLTNLGVQSPIAKEIMANAVFFIDRPSIFVGYVTKATSENSSQKYLVYRTNEREYLNWSAKFPLPRIGDRIHITMNGIGPANVVGFFKEEGFIGVMTKAINPPQWLVNQREQERKSPKWDSLPDWRKQGIDCEFGAEVDIHVN